MTHTHIIYLYKKETRKGHYGQYKNLNIRITTFLFTVSHRRERFSGRLLYDRYGREWSSVNTNSEQKENVFSGFHLYTTCYRLEQGANNNGKEIRLTAIVCRASLCNASIFRPTCRKTSVLLHVNQPIGHVAYNGVLKLKFLKIEINFEPYDCFRWFTVLSNCKECVRTTISFRIRCYLPGQCRRPISHVPVDPTFFVAYNIASILWSTANRRVPIATNSRRWPLQ